METKLTVIVDNIAREDLSGEWGLCILAQYNDKKILIDTGASHLFADNLKKLGFDISEIDYAVLSHAHYDHANGMPLFFDLNKKAKFYVRETTGANCYHKKYFFRIYIGIPRKVLTDHADRIEIASGDYKVCEGVYLIPHKSEGLDTIGRREMMYRRIDRKWVPDDFSHEQSLVLDTDKGLVIVNSCSHGGAVNIINEVSETFPDRHIHALVGGLHLHNKSEEEIRSVSNAIKQTGIDKVYTGHCTKNRAFNIMKDELGDKVAQFNVGYEMTF
jgi:7,8-dihydropterin-6-yl-methyl-4-(beta-D-ribofuranosyl)aminobenzene 5'-phosphate synthase